MSYKLYFSCSGEERGGCYRVAQNDRWEPLVEMAEGNPGDYDEAYIDDSHGRTIWQSGFGFFESESFEREQDEVEPVATMRDYA